MTDFHSHSSSFWDERYGSADRLWSGNANQRLVEQVSELLGRDPEEIDSRYQADD